MVNLPNVCIYPLRAQPFLQKLTPSFTASKRHASDATSSSSQAKGKSKLSNNLEDAKETSEKGQIYLNSLTA